MDVEGVPATGWSSVLRLLCFLAFGGGAQGTQQLKWYLQGPLQRSGNRSSVPVVAVRDALEPTVLQAAVAFAATVDDDFTGTEWWFSLGDAPRNPLEEAVQSLLQLDLQSVLPPAVADRIAGVSWRCNISPLQESHDFHFDSDEGTDNYYADMPHVNPLLSTVTYLTGDGGPTVLFEYSELDAADADVLPLAGFISMPLAGKHLAFDPRLFHGVVAGLRFEDREKSMRVILGMNLWELKNFESRRPEADGRQQQRTSQAKRPARARLREEDADYPQLVSGAGDAAAAIAGARCAESWVELPQWAALAAGETVSPRPMSLMEAAELEAEGEAGQHVQLSALGVYFKRARFPVMLHVNFPRRELYDKERARRGQTLPFLLGCADLLALHGGGSEPFFWEGGGGASAEEIEAALASVLETRCGLFGADRLALSPPLAAGRCLELSGEGLSGRGPRAGATSQEL